MIVLLLQFWLIFTTMLAQPAGKVVRVPSGADLQAAIDSAQPGDIIGLAPGATYTGNFVLRDKPGDRFITIRTLAFALPPAGQRMFPEPARRLAKLRSPNRQPVLRTAPRAHHWRLELLEFLPTQDGAGNIIELGDGSTAQSDLAQVPHHLVIDRCYVHGDPIVGQRRGIALNSGDTQIVNSYISDMKGVGVETQAITGWNGPGPFHIENNYLEAAGVNFMLGGADPAIQQLVPADLTFRRNHVAKSVAWRNEGWVVKNLFELKNARRALVEENLFEYNWPDGQAGYAILFTPRNSGSRAPWVTVEDVTFRNNVIRHVAAGINILGRDERPSGRAERLQIVNNLFYDVNGPNWGGNGFFMLVGDGPASVNVEHNTIVHTGNVISVYGGTKEEPVQVDGFRFRSNIAPHNRFGIHGSGRAVGLGTLEVYFPRAEFSHNALAGGRSSQYPGGNMFPSIEQFRQQFVDFTEGDFRLKPDSIFRRAGADGTDAGADIRLLAPAFNAANDRHRAGKR
jgi:hypothetical protein